MFLALSDLKLCRQSPILKCLIMRMQIQLCGILNKKNQICFIFLIHGVPMLSIFLFVCFLLLMTHGFFVILKGGSLGSFKLNQVINTAVISFGTVSPQAVANCMQPCFQDCRVDVICSRLLWLFSRLVFGHTAPVRLLLFSPQTLRCFSLKMKGCSFMPIKPKALNQVVQFLASFHCYAHLFLTQNAKNDSHVCAFGSDLFFLKATVNGQPISASCSTVLCG